MQFLKLRFLKAKGANRGHKVFRESKVLEVKRESKVSRGYKVLRAFKESKALKAKRATKAHQPQLMVRVVHPYIIGDSANNTITFTSGDSVTADTWIDVEVLESEEKHSSILNKISTMFKNVRYLHKLLGTTDISSSGDGTITGILKVILEKMTWKNFANKTGATEIALPDDFSELLIKVNVKSLGIILNIPILNIELYDNVQAFRGGWHQYDINGGMISFVVSKTSIALAVAYLNEEEVTAATAWNVYYR